MLLRATSRSETMEDQEDSLEAWRETDRYDSDWSLGDWHRSSDDRSQPMIEDGTEEGDNIPSATVLVTMASPSPTTVAGP